MKLIRQALKISVKKMTAYPNEIWMVFVYALLSLVTTVLFWKILFSNLTSFGYGQDFIYTLAILGLLSDGISELFFGLRAFEQLVREGTLDAYLYRPRNTLCMVLLERIPLVAFLGKSLLGVAGLAVVALRFHLHFSPGRVLAAVVFLLVGVLYYQILYGTVTWFSLWMEHISQIRDLLFQFSDSKKYPLTIFPRALQKFLTYIVPMSLMAFYPTMILTGRGGALPKLYLALPAAALLSVLLYRYGMKQYASNGG